MSLFGELLRVSAGALAGLAEVDLEELRAEGLHLLLHHRPRVERLDDRAEPPRRRDGLKAGDARADDEDFRGRDRARGRRQHREEFWKRGGREKHGFVAGDRCLRRKRVHRLRACDTRDRVHRERGHASPRELAHQTVVCQRRQERDQDGGLAQSRELLVGRPRHFDDQLGIPCIADRPARLGVHAIGKARCLAGAALDDDFVPALGETTDRLRDEGDPPLAGRGLPHDTDPHGMRKA